VLLIAGTFIGGLGLFLLAVSMITEGLKLAAGDALRDILARYTSTPLRGVASGILVTGVVQSSSAVTVATIGFVNAGLLSLRQSLGIIYGANVGTTMTGWLVAVVGFNLDLESFALPLIGIGMLARLTGERRTVGAVGEALAGFGLFFVGVDVLQQAFQSFADDVQVGAIAPQSGSGLLLYVGLGFLMTVATQSSSAAIAITLTAASGGVLGFDAAAAAVIGANVGTTSTAALAVIGATANARRVAAAHVVFNLVTGLVAVCILPLMTWAVRSGGTALGLADTPVVSLALFHTGFNVLGLLLMWPLSQRLADFLSGRFRSRAEMLAKPAYLDQNVLATPALAMDALRLELGRAVTMTREAVRTAVSVEGPPDHSVEEQRQVARGLLNAIESFVIQMETARLAADQSSSLPLVLRITNYLEDVMVLAADLDNHRDDVDALMRPDVYTAVAEFQADVLAHVDRCDPAADGFGLDELAASYSALRQRWHDLKTRLLEAATLGNLPIARLNSGLEGLRSYLKIAEQLTKVAERLVALGDKHPPFTDASPDSP
jgi:phosphate:Na+ symporter